MPQTKPTGLIRIVRVPEGEAPQCVRQAWVGLELPCDPYLGYSDAGLDRGVLTGTEAARNRCGFSVPQDWAIAVLEQSDPAAAAWWRRHGFPKEGDGRFGFAEVEAEIVSGVERQRLIEVPEEAMGDPYR